MTLSDIPACSAADIPAGAVGAFPCTLSQQRMWRQTLQPSNGAALNVAMRWLVLGRLSGATVEKAINILIARHEILRTSFAAAGESAKQVVWPSASLKVHELDLTFLGEDAKATRAEAVAREEARTPFALDAAPLLRARMLRFDQNRNVILLTFHAMAADGWSIGRLIREFRIIAAAIDEDERVNLPTPELHFADYALWERESLASGQLESSLDFWQTHLKGARPTQVPGDRARGQAGNGESEIVSILLSEDFGKEAATCANEHGATLYALAAAALAAALGRVTGETDIVIGSQVANRSDPLAENIIGPIFNSVTLRLPSGPDLQLRDVLNASSAAILDALEHQQLPFEAIFTQRFGDGCSPFHRINLVVQRDYSAVTQDEGEKRTRFTMTNLPSCSTGPLWDLNFFMVGRKEGWRISCEADLGLYDISTAAMLVNAWRAALEALITDSTQTCDTLPPAANRVYPAPSMRVSTNEIRRAPPMPIDPDRQIFRLHPDGGDTPVIALNNRSVYFPLAQGLGPNRPFIDIQLYHPDGPFELPRRALEDFAVDAVRLIRLAQPRGPYVLSGHCMFGVVAFEAAQQLQRADEEVKLVALFDTWAPGYREDMSPYDKWRRGMQLRLSAYAKRIRQFRAREIGLREVLINPMLNRLGLVAPEPPGQPAEGEWFDEYLKASVKNYRPPPYRGNVLVVRSQGPLRGTLFDDRMGWAPLVEGRLTKIEVSGGQLDMLGGHSVVELATHMGAVLAEIERK